MRIVFPHMGNLYIPLKTIVQSMGNEVIIPPANTKKTLELGTKYSPETACLPFKMSMGNFMEALEQGADTILTCGGIGPCRLGYYAQVQKQILVNLGYKFEMLIVEPNVVSVFRLFQRMQQGRKFKTSMQAIYTALKKIDILDHIEKKVMYLRPRAQNSAVVNLIWQKTISAVNQANTKTELDEIQAVVGQELASVPQVKAAPLKIGICGEIYVMLDWFTNRNLAEKLGTMGVEVVKNTSLSDYIYSHLLPNFKYRHKHQQTIQLAQPFLGHFVGGHGTKNIGSTVLMGQNNYDGIIHVMPFTCMPEVIAKVIMPKVSKELNIPVLSLIFDEQSGEAGLVTRLEAFVDLLKYRRHKLMRNQLG